MFRRSSMTRAQSMIEYAVVAAVVAAALGAMSTYVYRAVQAKQADILEYSRTD